MQIAETAAIERRTVGSEGSMNGLETNEYNKIELEDEQEVGVKETNKENGRNKEKNAGTSSSDR